MDCIPLRRSGILKLMWDKMAYLRHANILVAAFSTKIKLLQSCIGKQTPLSAKNNLLFLNLMPMRTCLGTLYQYTNWHLLSIKLSIIISNNCHSLCPSCFVVVFVSKICHKGHKEMYVLWDLIKKADSPKA
jgi:hypothetical protein